MQKSVLDFILSKDLGLYEKIEFNEEYKNCSDRAFKEYEKLQTMLNDEQKEVLNKFVDADSDQRCAATDIYFRAGIKFGFRLAFDCLSD